MRTVGVDLAAEATGTAVATIDWAGNRAAVLEVIVPADDDAVIEAVRSAEKAGIDCPLGWPDAFVSFVAAHREGTAPAEGTVTDKRWRRRLAWRHTDELVRAAAGIVPLSVAADRIGHTAMRCAALQARLARLGLDVDRNGSGAIVEVYPAASLKLWGLPWRGYKTQANTAARKAVVDALREAAPWLNLGPYEDTCRRADHALDAVVAALVARAVTLDLATRPAPGPEEAAARTEGWIALPTGTLAGLAVGR